MKLTCLFCGENVPAGRSIKREDEDIRIVAWDEECISIVLNFLFQPTDVKDTVASILKDGDYCSPCKVRFRDLSLVHRIISNASKRKEKLVKEIVSGVRNHMDIIKRRRQALGTLEKSVKVLCNELKVSWDSSQVCQDRYSGEGDDVAVPGSVSSASREKCPLSTSGEISRNSLKYPTEYHIIKDELDEDDADVDSVSVDFCPMLISPSFESCEDENIVEGEKGSFMAETKEADQQNNSNNLKTDEGQMEPCIVGTRSKRSWEPLNSKIDSESEIDSVDPDGYLLRPKRPRSKSTDGFIDNLGAVTSVEDVPCHSPQEYLPSENEEDDDQYEASKDNRSQKRKRSVGNIGPRNVDCRFDGCKAKFQKEIFMEAHYKRKHLGDPKPYQCSECLSKFRDHTDFTRHLKTSHKRMKINSRKGEVRERKIQARRGKVKYTVDCRDEDCNKQFLSDLHMQGHYNKVHLGIKDSPYRCELCKAGGNDKKGFHDYFDLKRHYRQVHQKALPDDRSDDFTCQQCDKIFGMKADLTLHISIKHKVKSGVPCTVCTKLFPTSDEVESHKSKVHTGNNPYTCEDCQIVFSTGMSLKNHVKHVHPPPGRVQCSLCQNKSFLSETHLKTHEYLAHPELRGATYKCEYCEKIVNTYYQLREHKILVHPDKMKTHPCTSCDKVFKRAADLHNHKKSAHNNSGETNYKCTLCPKSFRTLNSLTSHEEIHAGLNHVCHVCGKQLKTRRHLARHVTTVHCSLTNKTATRKPKQTESEQI